MTQNNKLEAYKQHMAAKGVGEATAFPPAWHMLWSMGLRVPPPPFLGFLTLTALAGGLFGPLFALGAFFLGNRGSREMAVGEAFWLALIAGAAFGLIMAAYYRHLGRKHRLGSWAAFRASGLRT
jgi:hypothetical protein